MSPLYLSVGGVHQPEHHTSPSPLFHFHFVLAVVLACVSVITSSGLFHPCGKLQGVSRRPGVILKPSISRVFSLKTLEKFSGLLHPTIGSYTTRCSGRHITKQLATQCAFTLYIIFKYIRYGFRLVYWWSVVAAALRCRWKASVNSKQAVKRNMVGGKKKRPWRPAQLSDHPHLRTGLMGVA